MHSSVSVKFEKNPDSKNFDMGIKSKLSNLMNRRLMLFCITVTALLILIAVALAGILMPESAYATNFSQKNLAPSFAHPFGTDWTGRDMLARTIKGLSVSLQVGTFSTMVSCCLAVFLGIGAATMGRAADTIFSWLVDIILGVPHAVLLILISFAVGKGVQGVFLGVAITHWPKVARIIRAEVLQLRSRQYIRASAKLGRSKWEVAKIHIVPQIIPQFIIASILLFPHAILHEASITFLGYGLPPEMPSVGIILAESMRYLTTGMWWLTVMPGVSLIFIVLLFEAIGENIRTLTDPYRAHE
ncbi:MAG: ABC transporter permease [Synergistaceae bacterium]|jgi:peptide/nickel transport system permease protein|nr:ABC transporter permease [Synergistaceae bacterium]